mmetsp:Transcript_53122/g.125517  ORF Transcript_53122/g.125517 Transcript_53122/m.125517 type:complete len:331 (-) Transcript_53122:209-1201(-)
MSFNTGKSSSLVLGSVLLCLCLFASAEAYISTPLRTFGCQPRVHSNGRVCSSPSSLVQLRAQYSTPPPPDGQPADGSLEKILGNLGPTGAKIGKGIDWFFDTSTISGAKAWRLQVVPGEADSARWRGREEQVGKRDIEDVILDEIQERKEKGMQVELEGVEGGAFTDAELEETYSMSDADLGAGLTARLREMSVANLEGQDLNDRPLTGAELALMCYRKYGLYHDMALKCDKMQLVSDKRMVSVNIYYAYFGQLNPRFQYSEAEYLAKLDAIASAVTQWRQTDYVREFFAEKPTAYRGLPSRPRWDTAVSIRLNKSPTWDEALADDWFLQ